jgi:hypothetical protein
MPIISARSAWDWAEKLAVEYGEPFDLVLREILVAVHRGDVSAHYPDDFAETWRILASAIIERIDRDRRGHIDPEPVLGPGILGNAQSIVIDTVTLERWLSARAIEQRCAPASDKPSNGRQSDQIVDGPASPSGVRTTRAADAERACEQWVSELKARPTNKDVAFEAAVTACGIQLSRKAFERAWANTAPSAWRKAGRRKGSS